MNPQPSNNNLLHHRKESIGPQTDNTFFEFAITDLEIKIGLFGNKAIGIAKIISEVFEERDEVPIQDSKCAKCEKKFIPLIRKRHPCNYCRQDLCQKYRPSNYRCLDCSVVINCEKLEEDLFEKVIRILETVSKGFLLYYRICSQCYLELAEQFKHLHESYNSKKPPRFKRADTDNSEVDLRRLKYKRLNSPVTPHPKGNQGQPHKRLMKFGTTSFHFVLNPLATESGVSGLSEYEVPEFFRKHGLYHFPAMERIVQELEAQFYPENLIVGVAETVSLA